MKQTNNHSLLSKARNFFMFDDRVVTRRKTYASLWSIFIGLAVASLIYWIITISGDNPASPFTFIYYLFTFAFDSDTLSVYRLIGYFLIFAFAGLGVAIGFKSGLFNIGIAGQMQLPAILFFAIIILAKVDIENVSFGLLFAGFLLFIVVSMFIGAFAGFLKAYFNVHEVISTIFLNWIVTYIGVYLFTRVNNVFDLTTFDYLLETHGTKQILISNEQTANFLIIGVVLLLALCVTFWFIYQHTTIGYKMKMVGLNKTNSKYVGINEKLTTIITMAISGGLAGIAGFFYTIIISKNYGGDSVPLTIGFEAIAIALIALNSPIGVLFAGLLYAIIYNGQSGFQLLEGSQMVGPDFFPIINGIIIFLSALAIIFYKFKPLRGTIKFVYLLFNKEYWQNKKLRSQSGMKYLFKEYFAIKKLYFINWKLKSKFRKNVRAYENYVAQKINEINKLENQIKNEDDVLVKKNVQNQVLDIYNDIAVEKFKYLKMREEFGLNKYYDAKNKFKNQIYSRKVAFRSLKEKLFMDFVKEFNAKIFGKKEEREVK
ncbi:ABC transporter permease [Mycoplasma buteonis]|uniref:ABC transporter permease n=1 Tax=Mycoplasma buteonis TaxID=171280 RepID=UPI00056009F0|nr:ABC transporter permease [Mycoplasma buteonis]